MLIKPCERCTRYGVSPDGPGPCTSCRDLAAAVVACEDRRCRACGCNDNYPCIDPPCGWAEPDLCTRCRDSAVVHAAAERGESGPPGSGL